ncbi:poly(A)-binding protein binding protein, partial [Teratosphaeriaceae sp. CCFEE 6253]
GAAKKATSEATPPPLQQQQQQAASAKEAASIPTPVSDQRSPFGQQARARASQQSRGGPQFAVSPQGQSPRGAPSIQGRNNGSSSNQPFGRGTAAPAQPPPQLAEIRVPTGPASAMADRTPLSPASATRFNMNAMEFKPIAAATSGFAPTTGSTATPSPPKRKASTTHPQPSQIPTPSAAADAEATGHFFAKAAKPITDDAEQRELASTFDTVDRLLDAEYSAQEKKILTANGDVPLPFRTPPTWSGVDSTTFRDAFARAG